MRGRMTDKQRKGMFARLKGSSNPQLKRQGVNQSSGKKPSIIVFRDKEGNQRWKHRDKKGAIYGVNDKGKKLSYTQLKKKGINLKPKGDIDGDGVQNSKDCKPFDPKKQGFLHDLNIRRLKAKEQKLEVKRIKAEKKLEQTKETLDARVSISRKKNNIKQAKIAQKQSYVDEINKERARTRELKEENKRAKRELFRGTALGKTVNFSKNTLRKSKDFLNKPSTRAKIQRVNRALAGSPPRRRSVKRRRTVKHKRAVRSQRVVIVRQRRRTPQRERTLIDDGF